jgi:hypothetical protein
LNAPSSRTEGIGELYDSDASLPKHAPAVASYTLRARLDPQRHTVEGEGTITWRNASSVPQRELWVHLYLNAFENERTVFLRTPHTGFRGRSRAGSGSIDVTRFEVRQMGNVWPTSPTTPGDPNDRTDIRVALPREVEPDETIQIDVAWTAHLPVITLRTGYSDSFHMVAQWFPKLARLEPDGRWAHFPFHPFSEFYADYGAYDVAIDVPEPFVVGATGAIEEETRAEGRVVRRYRQADVHDFAFAAWDHFEEKTAVVGDVTLRCLYPRGFDAAAETELDAAKFGLGHFGARYGRYPYETLTIVHPPPGAEEAGGMEYPTLITTGGAWYAPFIGVHELDIVTIHELAHQWFYGLVGTNEHAYPFLDEGITSYAELEAMEARFPNSSIASTLGARIGLPAVYRAGAVGAVAHHGPIARAASEFATGGDYAKLVYFRTATLLTTFERVYGSELVQRAIGRYARQYRYAHPGPEELLQVIGEVMGSEAEDELRQALFAEGWVDYSVDDLRSEPRSTRGRWGGEVLVRRMGTLRFPVDIDLQGADGSVQRVRWTGEDGATRISYQGTSRLIGAVVDPEHRVMLDDRLDNNARAVSSSLYGPRVLEVGAFFSALGLSVLAP